MYCCWKLEQRQILSSWLCFHLLAVDIQSEITYPPFTCQFHHICLDKHHVVHQKTKLWPLLIYIFKWNIIKMHKKTNRKQKTKPLCYALRNATHGPQKLARKTVLVASRALIAHTQNNATCETENAADSPQVRQAGWIAGMSWVKAAEDKPELEGSTRLETGGEHGWSH